MMFLRWLAACFTLWHGTHMEERRAAAEDLATRLPAPQWPDADEQGLYGEGS